MSVKPPLKLNRTGMMGGRGYHDCFITLSRKTLQVRSGGIGQCSLFIAGAQQSKWPGRRRILWEFRNQCRNDHEVNLRLCRGAN